MKKLLNVMVSMTGLFLLQPVAIAQEYEGCFIIDSRGNLTKLTQLCPNNSQETKPKTTPGVFQAPIKRREAGIPVIDVTFNGQQKFEMFVDSGASITKITEQMAKALKLKPEGKIQSQIANGEIIESATARVDSIEVAGAVNKNLTVTIGSVALLGQNFFSNYDMTIKKDAIEFRLQSAANPSEK